VYCGEVPAAVHAKIQRIVVAGSGFHGCRNKGAPLQLPLGQVLKVGLTIEGTIGDQRGQAIAGVPLMHMGPNGLANALGIIAVATEWLHQEGGVVGSLDR
jgi:hypothetical protein